jgi:hypothetical protein
MAPSPFRNAHREPTATEAEDYKVIARLEAEPGDWIVVAATAFEIERWYTAVESLLLRILQGALTASMAELVVRLRVAGG